MSGSVVTFYSYKGGVGRTFALANVAVILAQWGYRVLAVDWDIEAPGLVPYFNYFEDFAPTFSAGVLDFLQDCMLERPRDWTAYAAPIRLPNVSRPIHVMPAAASKLADYVAVVQDLNWDELYNKHDFSNRLEKLRASWIEEFDLVLIDSRTGITDFTGLTTAQLPDVLAFFLRLCNGSTTQAAHRSPGYSTGADSS